ncbi:hypothetical protein EOE67_05125 [Rheinheimera riviphila]|uniref:DUF883 family protein n=1 Tax=Rheinheimera riviphila TaxID=1834037 RepID=A0A437R0Y8_9GAMM|nr:hypothetical protein [Rheinheimera riviphila]RVU40435.1 hypothetical protein EOE67_05125 [Rheinheimera riviphila]
MTSPIEAIQNSKDQKIEQVRHSVNSAIHYVSEAIHPAIDSMTNTAHDTVDRLAGAAGHAAENMELKSAQLNAARVRLTEKVRGQIKARPLTTIGVAVASGIVLSWLLKSRK